MTSSTTAASTAEFGQTLRRLRQRAQLTQQDVAERLEVQRATLSQWETGKHLPSAENVAELDRLLDAGDELVSAADLARSGQGDTKATLRAEQLTLHDVHQRLGRVLVDALVIENGRTIGWRRDFQPGLPPSAFTTASAVRLLTLLDDPPHVDRHALGEALLRFHEGGGWSTRRVGLRPETTAVVIDALVRVGARLDVDRALDELKELLDENDRSRTYVLAEALSTVARLRPRSPLANDLVADLLGTRAVTQTAAWPEKRPPLDGVVPQGSTAHTARAVSVLAHGLEAGLEDPDGVVADAVDEAVVWLQDNARLAPIRENVEPGGRADLEIRHFTPALVAHALASVPRPPWPLVQRALDEVWSYYQPRIGRWAWPNGDVPVWLQQDALLAVEVAAARTTPVPVPAETAS